MDYTIWQFFIVFPQMNASGYIPVKAISSEEANWVEGPKEGQSTLFGEMGILDIGMSWKGQQQNLLQLTCIVVTGALFDSSGKHFNCWFKHNDRT